MPTSGADQLARVVAATVGEQLTVDPAQLEPRADLRMLRSFSSFRAVTILEHLEDALGVEIPASRLTADRLCSVAALTELFAEALAGREGVTP